MLNKTNLFKLLDTLHIFDTHVGNTKKISFIGSFQNYSSFLLSFYRY